MGLSDCNELLGRTGARSEDGLYVGLGPFRVSRLGFGCAAIGQDYPSAGSGVRDKEKAIALLQAAFDEGITFFDTAYSYGQSEEWVGEALGHTPAVLATKIKRGDDYTRSLDDLRRSRFDLLQVHNYTGQLDVNYMAIAYAKLAGATIYTEDDLKSAVTLGIFDTIQFPFNISNTTFGKKRGAYFSIARSVLGRGDLALQADPSFLIRFALSQKDIDLVLVGISNEYELQVAVDAWRLGRLKEEECIC